MFCVVVLGPFCTLRSFKGSFKASKCSYYATAWGLRPQNQASSKVDARWMVHCSWPGATLGPIYRIIGSSRPRELEKPRIFASSCFANYVRNRVDLYNAPGHELKPRGALQFLFLGVIFKYYVAPSYSCPYRKLFAGSRAVHTANYNVLLVRLYVHWRLERHWRREGLRWLLEAWDGNHFASCAGPVPICGHVWIVNRD